MTDDRQHPSFLELDRLMLGAARNPATAGHVSGCLRCRAHMDGLRAVPPLAADLRARAAASPPRPTRRWLFGGLGLAGLCAAATAVLLVPRARTDLGPAVEYLGDKGLTSVWIYVKRGNELSLWDGERPLAPGDRLRLRIDPQGHRHADVFTLDGRDGALTPIWSGALAPDGVTTLPAAWRLEGDAPSETLVVILGSAAVSVAEARRFIAEGAPKGTWLRTFVLPKTPPNGRAP